MAGAPVLEGDAQRAVDHRGSHLQIIAAAGSGKTEVVSQRVAALLAEGVDPRGIVAFTFTDRAAEELRQRIELRALGVIGPDALDRIGGLFVGTIHSYCFQLLQRHVARYETFDVLDENQLTAFLTREANRLEIRQLDPKGQNRLFASIQAFLEGVDVIDNELLDPMAMPEPFRGVLTTYYDTLERYRLLTFGLQIAHAVAELNRDEVAATVHAELRHLIVDEYQDVNPAQERLIRRLTGPEVELCVVGDDDQAIYQWRGSDVSNIVTFSTRYEGVATFKMTANRRSRPQIIDVANVFAKTIPERLEKTMGHHRESGGDNPAVVVWNSEFELEEAGWIAELILRLNDDGTSFRDMAVLVRTSAAYAKLVAEFAAFDIPVQPGGRTGLFDQPEARVIGRTFCWIASADWREGYDPSESIELEDLLEEYVGVFHLSPRTRNLLRRRLKAWQTAVPKENRTADLVGEYYELLADLDVRSWDLGNPILLNRLGTLARFSSLLADYESVRRRARADTNVEGEQVGGEDRGTWYYRNLAYHIVNHAQRAYDGFDGEQGFALDAVDLLTVHRAKGLEWPVVFVPSLTKNRFPSGRTGQTKDWLVPRQMFAADRYEGTDGDERRLFYVATTRARDWVSLSRHDKVNVQRTAASPYWEEHQHLAVDQGQIRFPEIVPTGHAPDEPVMVTFSELSSFLDCGLAYRFRTLIGFEPPIAPELGYGKAVHHVMRTVAERTRETGKVPDEAELDDLLDESFYLPAANKPAHRNLKDAARRLIRAYTEKHADDLHRVWETERPFELHLDGVTVVGRADVVLDREDGRPESLAILDYKTSTDGDIADYALQVQVYADAGRREGLDVQGAYIHDLRTSDRTSIDIDDKALAAAETTVRVAAERLRERDYAANPGTRCRTCDVRHVCASARA